MDLSRLGRLGRPLLAVADRLPAPWLALLGLVLGALQALAAGQDVNWDLSNYHYYDGWAAVTGGGAQDLWPAQAQSFFNPILPALAYGLLATLPPWAAAMALGAVQGLNYALVVLIARQAFAAAPNRPVLVAAAAIVGVLAPMVRAEIGTTFGDNLASLPLLAAVLTLGGRGGGRALTAGLLAGVAAGLKLTNAPYAVALAVSGGCRGIRPLGRFVAGAALGGLALAAPWAWHLWMLTGNPLFPYFNDLFRSDWVPPAALQDRRFLPASPLDALMLPVRWALGWHPASEPTLRDLRPLAVWLLAAAWALAPRRLGASLWLPRAWLIGFVLWLVQFAIHRYLLPLELLSGVVLLQLAQRLRSRPVPRAGVAVAAVMLVLWTRAGDWGRRPFGPDWFGVAVPADLADPGRLFVMLGGEPMAYVVPFFPAGDIFVRIQGNLPVVPGTRTFALAAARIDGHRGPLSSLGPQPPGADAEVALAQFGLARAPAPCVAVATRTDRLWACPLTHAGRH